MPAHIVGLLQQDTMTSYVLSNVIEQNEDFEWIERKELDFINKTYVWRCEVLGELKPIITSEDKETGFGLG